MHPRPLAGEWSIWNSDLVCVKCLCVTTMLFILFLERVKVVQHPTFPPGVLVRNSGCNKVAQTRQLTTTELYSPQSWRLKSRFGQDGSLPWTSPRLITSGGSRPSLVLLAARHSSPRLCRPRAYFPMSLYPKFPFPSLFFFKFIFFFSNLYTWRSWHWI